MEVLEDGEEASGCFLNLGDSWKGGVLASGGSSQLTTFTRIIFNSC